MRVWLIRHGASSAPPGLAVGSGDPPLSDVGREQSLQLAASMADRPLTRVLSSDRRRALSTARLVAAPHGLDVEATAALREIDFGAWEGRALGDLWSEEPESARAWESDIRLTPPSFGESLDALQMRVVSFWDSFRPLPRDGEIAVVGHHGSLAVLRSLITGERIGDAFAHRLELGGALYLDAN
jgi:broad specificity phosphatase PhoE